MVDSGGIEGEKEKRREREVCPSFATRAPPLFLSFSPSLFLSF
jgi:hypothetical protein